MSMAVEQRPQPMGYDFKSTYGAAPMHFTDPFNSSRAVSSAPAPYHSHQQHQPAPMPHQQAQQQQQQQQSQQPMSRNHSVSMPYAANPAASSLGSSMLPLGLCDAWNLPADVPHSDLVPSRSYDAHFTAAPAQQSTYAPHAAAPAGSLSARYSPEHHAQAVSPYNGYEADVSRRSSYTPQDNRPSFSDALDASRGMLAMSQSQDLTPRPIYGAGHPSRSSSQDSYGFPAPHSHHGSVSSASSYPNYYNGSYAGSVDGSSVTDYSSASEDPMGQRTLPAPTQLINGYPPPEPSSMMTQFNSKMSPNQQKKHKCKICDKRFTRPSSLQTHMYSHTGEKPFACDHEGCGRHFSVVSNLRRHKKVHREDGAPDAHDDDE